MPRALWRFAMRKSWLLPILLLAGCTPPGPPRVVEERPFSGPAPRGTALLQRVMLAQHTAARATVGQPPLSWDAGLAADALAYAQQMARTGRFEHAVQPPGPGVQGENLWTGTRTAYRYDEMIRHWVDERRLFNGAPVPNSSTTGRFGDVGHYTQIIWSRTHRVGCAFASNARDDFLVCRYMPAGNVVGERALP